MADITPGWGQQWEILSSAITDYYGGGVGGAQYEAVKQMLNSGNYTMAEMESVIGQIPEFNRVYNSQGKLVQVTYNAKNAGTTAASSVANQINSNVNAAQNAQFSTTQTITKNAQTGKVAIGDDLVKYKTGQLAPTTVKGIFGSSVAALLATGVGIKLGKTIDSTLYNANPDFWDEHGMAALNPETWSSITAGDNGLGATLFNFVFDIDPVTGNPQPYIDEASLAYMTAYMASQGVFDDTYTPGTHVDNSIFVTGDITGNITASLYNDNADKAFIYGAINHSTQHPGTRYYSTTSISDPDAPKLFPNYYLLFKTSDDSVVTYGIFDGTVDFTTYNQISAVDSLGNSGWFSSNSHNNVTVDGKNYSIIGPFSPQDDLYSDVPSTTISQSSRDIFAAALAANATEQSSIDGITNQPGALLFNASGISDYSDIDAVLNALKTQYPELWENRIEVSPDGDITHIYVPVGFPTGGTGTQPTTNGATQQNTAPDISGDGANATDELIKTLIDIIQNPKTSTGMESDTDTPTKPIDPNEDPRGTGENPPIVPPIGSASALWKIYNPSQSQLDTFGAWLWSSNFVDQLLKVFNDPMQAIIGLHKVFCNPPISGSGPIKVGYLVSDASANYVSSQYTEIDCGEVNLKEKFGNVFDYDGFTRISVFLPFIGFRDLDTKDIMRGKMNIKYGIDVLTGACLAKIKITRDLSSPILYTFEGNCAVQYPVSSGSYIGIITGALGIAGSIAGTIATGGAMAPALLRAGAALPNMHANVQHSGNISSNVGALGPKKPYLVIQRPQTQMPQNGVLIEGEGQNESVLLGSLTGYVKVKKGDYNGIPGTSNELNEIRDLLENGIYME